MTDNSPKHEPRSAAESEVRTPAGRRGRRVRTLGRRLRALPAWAALGSAVLAGALAGGAYGQLRAEQYTATGYVVAVPAAGSDPQSALGFAQAYGRVATNTAVLAAAQKDAGVAVATLRESVRAATSPDAPMVEISATSERPARAADMANAVSRALTGDAGKVSKATGVELVQFAPASAPVSPSTSATPVTALVGAAAGGLLAGLALLVRPRRGTGAGQALVPAPAGEARQSGTAGLEAGV